MFENVLLLSWDFLTLTPNKPHTSQELVWVDYSKFLDAYALVPIAGGGGDGGSGDGGGTSNTKAGGARKMLDALVSEGAEEWRSK